MQVDVVTDLLHAEAGANRREVVITCRAPVRVAEEFAANLDGFQCFGAVVDVQGPFLGEGPAEVGRIAQLLAGDEADGRPIVIVIGIQAVDRYRYRRRERRPGDFQLAELPVPVGQIVLTHKRVLAEADSEALVIEVNIAFRRATTKVNLQGVSGTPANAAPARVLVLRGDFLEVAIERLVVVAGRETQHAEQVVVATDAENRALETVRDVLFQVPANDEIRDDTVPAVLRCRIVALVITIAEPDSRLVKNSRCYGKREVARIDAAIER